MSERRAPVPAGLRAPLQQLRKRAFALPLVLAVVVLTVPAWISDPSDIRQIMLIAVFSLVVSGTNLSFGYAGEIQFAQVFMFAVGAYVSMGLATHGLTEVIPLLLLGALGAAAIAVVIALPAVRIGGWALAMTSFFLIIALPDVIRIFGKYTGGDVGLFAIPTPELFGHPLGATGLYELVTATAIIWFVLFRNLVVSRFSVLFAVLRESSVLTASLGQSVLGLRLLAYGLSAIPAGMAGCLYGFVALVVGPSEFGLSLTIGILAASVIGGASSVYGAIIGATLLQLGPQTALSFANYEPIAFGAFLALAGIVFRHGLAGLATDLLRRLTGRYDARVAGSDAPAQSADGAATPTADPSALLGDVEPRALRITGLTKAFGGVRALSEVSLQAQPGRITALIGANGSGKTTLLNLISGYVSPDGGTAVLGDVVLSHQAPHRVARHGVARTFQTPKVPHGVSVLDVVASARYAAHKVGVVASVLRLPRYWSTRRDDRAVAAGVLALLGIEEHARAEASTLSLGLRRLVEVARAVCSGSSLVLLDEPASGLNDSEVARLGAVLKILSGRGMTVVLIEHNFAFVREVTDYAYVLNVGSVIAAGTPAEIATDPQVISSYLGEEPAEPDGVLEVQSVDRGATATIAQRAVPTGDAMLAVRGLAAGYRDLRVLHGVDIDVHPGRVELLLGRNGVGKTTLLSAICGLARVTDGTITLSGQELRGRPVYRRAGDGLALVQEGKRVFHARTVQENVLMGTRSLKVSAAERRAICAEVIERFPVLTQRLSTRAGSLSGGQQQMLAIAQALASRPKVLLLDEPSAGLSPAIVSELFAQVRLLADEGLAVLLVEQLAAKALTIADHVTLLDRGRVVATGAAEQFRDGDMVQRAYFGTEASIG